MTLCLTRSHKQIAAFASQTVQSVQFHQHVPGAAPASDIQIRSVPTNTTRLPVSPFTIVMLRTLIPSLYMSINFSHERQSHLQLLALSGLLSAHRISFLLTESLEMIHTVA